MQLTNIVKTINYHMVLCVLNYNAFDIHLKYTLMYIIMLAVYAYDLNTKIVTKTQSFTLHVFNAIQHIAVS